MASLEDHHKANGVRLSRLLIDKGTQAVRNVFDSIHPPSTLTATLNSYHSFLKGLRYVNRIQLDILFPPSGVPSKSAEYDITLLFVLLRNICGLYPPVSTGSWDKNPPETDTSREANLARVKYYRNEVYGHVTSTGVTDSDFHPYWNDISAALVGLGVDCGDIQRLLTSPMEENSYINQVKDWKEKEDSLEVILREHHGEITAKQEAVLQNQGETNAKLETIAQRLDKMGETSTLEKNSDFCQMKHANESKSKKGGVFKKLKNFLVYKHLQSNSQQNLKATSMFCNSCKSKPKLNPDILRQLTKCDFKGDVRKLNKSFHKGTRSWLLEKVDYWLTEKDSESRVMVLTAGPGIGKSVFAAKLCQVYEESGKLAACHFCKFNYADYRDPHKMLQSLAVHMCEKVKGFEKALTEQLQRDHSRATFTDAFRVLLKDPLNSLEDQEPMVVVIDALDESEAGGKSELLDLIAEEFSELPTWIKLIITSRPELPVQRRLIHLNPIEIGPDDTDNKEDLKSYLQYCLSDLGASIQASRAIKRLVKRCEGSFLYAYHCQLELLLLKRTGKLRADDAFVDIVPQSIGVYYEKYFKRLEEELKKLSPDIDFSRILEAIVAMKGPLPLTFIAEILKLPKNTWAMKEIICRVNDSLSALLLVYDDCLTVFHKSVVDWLVLSSGYKIHRFLVTSEAGHRSVWRACRDSLMELEREATDKKKTAAQKYALNHGISHLEELTYLTESTITNDTASTMTTSPDLLEAQLLDYIDDNFSRQLSIAMIWFQQGKKRIRSGCGWLLSKSDEDAYLMTSSQILSLIQQSQRDKPQEESTVIIELPWGGSFTIAVQHDTVVVSSIDNSVLDYAVLKWKRNLFLTTPVEVSKQGCALGNRVYTLDASTSFKTKHSCLVAKYPEDLVNWLKIRSSSDCHSSTNGVPIPNPDRNVDWSKLEEQKESVIHHPNSYVSNHVQCPFGLPLLNLKDEVVGMISFRVYFDVGRGKTLFTSFSVRMDKIIEDIMRKKPELARKLFPS